MTTRGLEECRGKHISEGSNWLYAGGHVKDKVKSKADEAVNGIVDCHWLRIKP